MLGQIFHGPPSAEFPVIQFGPSWEINAVFRAIGQRQMAMVGPNAARTALHPGESLKELIGDFTATNDALLKKKMRPLFLALYLEQDGGTNHYPKSWSRSQGTLTMGPRYGKCHGTPR